MRLRSSTCALVLSLALAPGALADWSADFSSPPAGLGTDNKAPCLVEYDGALIVAGRFWTAGSLTGCGHIARFTGTEWSGRLRRGLDGPVTALGTWNGDLYAGGVFTSAGPVQPGGAVAVANVARWDGDLWHAMGSGLNDNPLSFATYGGDLIAAGYFTEAGSAPALRVASWDGTNWFALGTGLGAPALSTERVVALTVWNGDLWAGGTFLEIDGTPVTGLARWDGSSWSAPADVTFGNAFHGEAVEALAVYDGDLIVAGDIVAVDGVPVNGLARFDGVAWTDLGAGLGPAAVRGLSEYHGDLVATDGFTLGASTQIARWNGTTWSGFGDGIDPWDLFGETFRGVEFQGRFYVGGNIAFSGAFPASFFGRWTDPGTDAPVVAAAALGLSVSPNPSAGAADVRFALERAGSVELDAFDAAGRRVARLLDETRSPGAHTLRWNGRDATGARLPNGVYLLRLRTAGREQTQKVVLVR